MTSQEGRGSPPIIYSYVDAGADAPAPAARWAVRVQAGEADPQPTILAYAVSELSAKRLVMALRRSHRITLRQAQEAGRAYDEWRAAGEPSDG
jgi:hypothetical protein